MNLRHFSNDRERDRSLQQLSVLLFTARHYTSAVYAVIVCLSVRPSARRLSVTRRYRTKTAKCMITETTPYDSAETLFLSDAKDVGEIPTRLP